MEWVPAMYISSLCLSGLYSIIVPFYGLIYTYIHALQHPHFNNKTQDVTEMLLLLFSKINHPRGLIFVQCFGNVRHHISSKHSQYETV